MDIARLIEDLSRPEALPGSPVRVEVRQTHISAVFLAGDDAYKVKKPVDLGFLDFSTPEKRRHFCEEEVRLDRRLAPDVYLGVLPVTLGPDGRARLGGEGEPIDHAVHMRRLPDDRSLLEILRTDALEASTLDSLARRLAEFHRTAERSERISASGRLEVVAGNARENFTQTESHVGRTVSAEVRERLRVLTEEQLAMHETLIERRAAAGVPCDTHGDLHLDHVYLIDGEWVIIDGIEFNERFRHADPVADVAFLAMDLAFRGRRDLADAFVEGYLRASGDGEAAALLPFYVAYRATVRAKVKGFECLEAEVPEAARRRAERRARAHWLLALETLERPERRPCLLLVGGLPGTGKSVIAHGLGERSAFEVVRSDEVRKEIAAGVPDIYTPEWSERTYAECRRRAMDRIFHGGRVIVDATFIGEEYRHDFLEAARVAGVPVALIFCEADRELVRERLARRVGDASDADWSVYEAMERTWEPLGPGTARFAHTLRSEGTIDDLVEAARRILVDAGLDGPAPAEAQAAIL